MRNLYLTQTAAIVYVKNQNFLVRVFTLKTEDGSRFNYWPGQFIILSIEGFGEAPFAICSTLSKTGEFQICVQKKGILTGKLFALSAGDKVGFRGPYGNGFPVHKLTNRNLILIAGGVGLAPLRPLIQLVGNRSFEFGKIQLFCGAREKQALLFQNEYDVWQKHLQINLTLDTASENWEGSMGLITGLFDKIKLAKNPVAIICGPAIMYPSVIKKLKQKKVAENDIYVLLERRMHCGIGICQHCVLINGKYVCKDGPVFNYAEIKNSPGAI